MGRELSTFIAILCFTHCLAAPIISTAPPEASVRAALAARQDCPADFGSEIVTATINGTAFTFVHHFGFQLTNDADNNEVIDFSGPLLDAIQSIVDDTLICSLPDDTAENVHARAFINASKFDNLEKRVDIVTELVADPCFVPRMEEAISLIAQTPTGPLAMAIPAITNTILLPDFITTINLAFEMAYARTELDQFYSWAPIENRRLTVNILGIMMILASLTNHNIRTQAQYIFSRRLFRDQQDDTKACQDDDDIPACVDSNCHGDNGKCTTVANSGCECWPLLDRAVGYAVNPTMFNLQQNMIGRAHISSHPTCVGVGTQNSISRAIGALNINDFCGTEPIKYDQTPPGTHEVEYNPPGTSDGARLTINFGDGYLIPADECKKYLFAILDGCDGNNPDNPGNRKHGGTIQYAGGATLQLAPLESNPIYCNSYHNLKWVDISIGIDAVLQFCTEQSLTGHTSDRIIQTYNPSLATAVTLTLSLYQDYTMSKDDCVSQFRLILDNCDHNDMVNNPMDNKYGGTFTNTQGTVFVITPEVEPKIYPPDDLYGTSCRYRYDGYVKADEMLTVSKEFCSGASGFPYHTEYQLKGKGISLFGELLDLSTYYRSSNMACRPTTTWHDSVIEEDCLYAFKALQKDCSGSEGFYPYRCVEWSFYVFDFTRS